MAREWKPGDVGVALTGERFIVTLEGLCAWASLRGDVRLGKPAHNDRPLVVIDPEDREQVKRLDALIWATASSGAEADLAAALREFANPTPPKPEEPTGLGAVVEDARGGLWTNVTNRGAADRWQPNGLRSDHERKTWDDIAVVRVLSEGVTP